MFCSRSFPSMWLMVFFLTSIFPGIVSAQSSLPMVTTITLAESDIRTGAVVVYDDVIDQYRYGAPEDVVDWFGVVSDRPPLYIETATATVPVVVDGVTWVRAEETNGPIERGDLLRIGENTGAAERAVESDDIVFAVALGGAGDAGSGLVLADVSVARAVALRDAQAIANDPTQAESERMSAGAIAATTARIVVALGIAVGSLAFILYTYRSIWVTGVTAVGRNPRARSAVMLMNIASSVIIVVLAVFMVIVALGVLVVSI